MVSNRLVNNCPVTLDDINRAAQIYGPSLAALKGKTTRVAPSPVVTDYVKVLKDILQKNKDITIAGDVFFVNKIPFFATISCHLKFTTVQSLQNRTHVQLTECVKTVKHMYANRGFKVNTALMDGEFEPLRDNMTELDVGLNTTAANEHVPEIERHTKTIKERTHAGRSTLPFKFIPKLMMIHLVYNAVLWLNTFPPKGGVSTTVSPRTLMTGQYIDYNKHCCIPFGQYVQVHEENSPTNTLHAQTVGATCLGPKMIVKAATNF